jgi:holo-[acyl-carrier protein] synthase
MAVEGVGTDIIEVDRIRKAIQRQGKAFLDRVFTAHEQAYCEGFQEPERHYAGRFAAKEALAKALGCGIGASLSWLDVEVLAEDSGKPILSFSEKAEKSFPKRRSHLSISHCKSYATAVVLLEHHLD